MTGMAHGARSHPREPVILGIVLITIGLGALALNAYPDSGGVIVAAVGLGLVGIFVATRAYAALVPGAIMAGIGLGIVLSERVVGQGTGGPIVAGLGLGFVAIWVVGGLFHAEEHHPWPLIPGGILLTVGLMLMLGGAAVNVLEYWPVVLVAIGAILLGRALFWDRGS